MGGKKPLRRPLWPPTRATASNYYPLGLDGAGGAAKPLLRAPKKPAPLHGRLPAFSGAVDAFERARKCFLEWRYFFSIILSEFLKNRVALHRFPLYKFTIEDFQEDLTLSVCMLVKDGLSYRFSHRSFQEYFAALYTCKLTDDVQSKLLATWFDESISVVGDEYMAMLYNLQPDKVNKIVLCPGLKKLKELYDSMGFSVELLKELFSGVHLRRLYKLENSKRVTDYTIDFDISNRYLCNILMITCKLNHFFNPNAEGIKKTREIASTWVSEREKQDPQNRYRIEPIEFDDLMIFLDEHNFTVADFLEACKWIEARFIFSFKILEKYSENSISRKKKVSSILDEL